MMLISFLKSSLGKKIVMAVTGALLFGFLIVHMVGNWQIFHGQNAINNYAQLLQSNPLIVVGFRFCFFVLAAAHVWASACLTLENNAARPEDYSTQQPLDASLASRTMGITGVVVLAFIIWHILHFTVHVAPQDPAVYNLSDLQGRHDVYHMMIYAFQTPWISLCYILGTGLLCFHLSHGLESMFRTVGWSTRNVAPYQIGFARVAAIVIFLGMAAIPASVLLGTVKPSAQTQSAQGCPMSVPPYYKHR